MKLDFFMLADGAHVRDRKLDVIGGGISRVNLPALPFVLPTLSAVARCFLEPDDIGQERTFTFEWCRTAGVDPPSVTGPVRPGVVGSAAEDEELAIVVVATFNDLLFDREGADQIRLLIDGVAVAERRLAAVRIPASEAAGSES